MACVSKVFCMCGNRLDIVNIGLDINNELIINVERCSVCEHSTSEIVKLKMVIDRKDKDETMPNEQKECDGTNPQQETDKPRSVGRFEQQNTNAHF